MTITASLRTSQGQRVIDVDFHWNDLVVLPGKVLALQLGTPRVLCLWREMTYPTDHLAPYRL